METPAPQAPSFLLSKEALDTVNSVSWFLMDASWMLGLPVMGMAFILPTTASGILLMAVEKRPSVRLINLAINCWIWMNTLWMLSEFHDLPAAAAAARVLFAAGVLCVAAAAARSPGNVRETFSHFRRFRVMGR